MLKFGKSLIEYERQIIEFERKRTILYLSKYNHQELWINLIVEERRIVINGIINSIINGKVKKNKHLMLGGKFSFENNTYYPIEDIYAISFKPFSLEDDNFKKGWGDSFSSSILGDESELENDILFSSTDLKPQDFNTTNRDQSFILIGEFRKYNTRYYKKLAEASS